MSAAAYVHCVCGHGDLGHTPQCWRDDCDCQRFEACACCEALTKGHHV